MATSGTYTYATTRNEIIEDALSLLEVYSVGLPIEAQDLVTATRFLNKMVKAWQMQGLHLWKRQEGYLFLEQYRDLYDLGSTLSKACDTDDAIITDATTAVSAGASTVVCRSVTGMTTGMNIGIVNTSNAVEWFTISSINAGTKTVTLSGSLVTACSLNANVYTFATYLTKPLQITGVRRITGYDQITSSNVTTIEIDHMPYEDFQSLPNRHQNGAYPIAICYTPYNTTGRLEVWPRPSSGAVYLQFTYTQMVQDWTNAGDNPDFPIEWAEALTYGLAVRLAPVFGKDAKLQVLLPIASGMLEQILDADTDNTSIFINPSRGY